jgi:hypothetical protein
VRSGIGLTGFAFRKTTCPRFALRSEKSSLLDVLSDDRRFKLILNAENESSIAARITAANLCRKTFALLGAGRSSMLTLNRLV